MSPWEQETGEVKAKVLNPVGMSKGTEKAMGKRAYSAVGTMDKGSRRKSSKRAVHLGAGGTAAKKRSRNPALTPQHKRLAMGQSVPQGKSPVRMRGGGGAGRRKG